MNYKINDDECQLKIDDDYLKENKNYIYIPSSLTNFINTNTTVENNNYGNKCYCFYGYIKINEDESTCECGTKMHTHQSCNVKLKHIPFGGIYSYICVDRKQMRCPKCGKTKLQKIPFQAKKHFITIQAENYIIDLLSTNDFTNKEIAYLTGINRNAIKDIDKKRLINLYTVDGNGKELIKPKTQAKFLGIDEFKLHNGHKYATHIINLENGHILWIAEGKKKNVVYEFINHVGLEWMKNVIAIACDMNSNFEEAFREKCPHIKIVFDYFHIVKNFNEKVINEVRKDEYKRLINEKKYDEAELLKKSKYILISSKETLRKKDRDVVENKIISKESILFKIDEITRKGSYEDKYNKIIEANELLLIANIIKEKLKLAFSRNNEKEMAEDLIDIVILCTQTNSNRFKWFSKLIINHYDGIVSHATYKISSGKIEGINNKIKTLRRQAYGYPDDEYFFLKLFDMSRHKRH